MIDSFVAKVESGSGLAWKVTPQIINDDGNQHPIIDVTVNEGIRPKVGDMVLILTMKNNIDFSNINKFMKASYSNGVIIGILTSQDGKYYFRGSFVVDGDITIDNTNESGNGILKGTLEVKGNTRSLVTHAELNTALQTMAGVINTQLGTKLDGTGTPGTVTIDISSSKTDNIKTGPG